MDLSDYLKLHLQSYHKQKGATFGKNLKTDARSLKVKEDRRSTRFKLLNNKRSIKGILSPYKTPLKIQRSTPNKTALKVQKTVAAIQAKPSQPSQKELQMQKRYEMLKKWQEEKKRKQEEERRNVKPIFKVCHVNSNSTRTTDLDKEKVKCIPVRSNRKDQSKTASNASKYEFAPKNHQFRAPSSLNQVQLKGKENLHSNARQYNLRNRTVQLNVNEVQKKIKPQKISKHILSESKNQACLGTPIKTVQNEQSATPKTPVTYISPFVTISRGKESARKEYHCRKSKGGLFDLSPDVEKNTGSKAGAAYFRQLLNGEITRIQSLCNDWDTYKKEENAPEGACDMINVAIGQSNLLVNKKFKQFSNLIDTCERGDLEMPVTCEDLHGYWDTAYIQVENLDQRFNYLTSLRANNWEEILPVKKATIAIKKDEGAKAKPKVQASSKIRDAIKAARKAKLQAGKDDLIETCDVHPPAIKTPRILQNQLQSARKQSLRSSVLKQTMNNQISPSLMILKATQMAKSLEKINVSTPNRSILKLNGTESSVGSSKSVLFKRDNVDGDRRETLRRSTRTKLF